MGAPQRCALRACPSTCAPAARPPRLHKPLSPSPPAGNFEYGEDEMQLSGLTPLPSVKARWRRAPLGGAAAWSCSRAAPATRARHTSPALLTPPRCPPPTPQVRPPRVAESAVHLECVLRHTYDVKDAAGAVTCTIVIGEAVLIHVAEGVAGAPGAQGAGG